jgi:hypothetical protein
MSIGVNTNWADTRLVESCRKILIVNRLSLCHVKSWAILPYPEELNNLVMNLVEFFAEWATGNSDCSAMQIARGEPPFLSCHRRYRRCSEHVPVMSRGKVEMHLKFWVRLIRCGKETCVAEVTCLR